MLIFLKIHWEKTGIHKGHNSWKCWSAKAWTWFGHFNTFLLGITLSIIVNYCQKLSSIRSYDLSDDHCWELMALRINWVEYWVEDTNKKIRKTEFIYICGSKNGSSSRIVNTGEHRWRLRQGAAEHCACLAMNLEPKFKYSNLWKILF